jgi:hypothetical protein
VKVHDPVKPAQRIGLAACGVAALLSLTPAGAVDLTLQARAINEALLFGQSRIDTERRRFHQPYRVPINAGEVDFIEVVTPYRRLVLAAEDHVAIGDRGFGYRQAVALLEAAPQQVDLHVELTFNPLNVYVGVPDYRVTLTAPDGRTIEPRTFALYSRYTPRVSERPSVTPVPGAPLQPGNSQPLIGGTIIAGFDGRLLNATAAYSAVIGLNGKAVTRAPIDLAKLR